MDVIDRYDTANLEKAFPQFSDFEPIGCGGFGAVYSVWDKNLQNFVELKLMRDDADADAKRFEREYRILKQSNHARLVLVYSSGRCQLRMSSGEVWNHFWYTMEKCSSNLLSRMDSLVLTDRVRISLQILDGLAYLHEKHVAHRDIKPANIFLTKANDVRLGDFGLVKRATSSDTSMTPLGGRMGTPPYLAPERWEGKTAEHEDWRPSDQYAVGITLYEVLSRGTEFPLALGDGSVMGCFHAHLTGAVRSVVVPEYVDRKFANIDLVIARMLAKKPNDRYRSIASCELEFVWALTAHGLYRGPDPG